MQVVHGVYDSSVPSPYRDSFGDFEFWGQGYIYLYTDPY